MKINLEDIDQSDLKIAIYFNPNYFIENFEDNSNKNLEKNLEVYEKLKNVDFLDVYPKRFNMNYLGIFESIQNQVRASVINKELCNNIVIDQEDQYVMFGAGYRGPKQFRGHRHLVKLNDAIIKISNIKQNNKIYGFSIINFEYNSFTGRYKIGIPLQCSNKFISVSGIGRKLLNLIKKILNSINNKEILNTPKSIKSSKSIKNKSIKSSKSIKS